MHSIEKDSPTAGPSPGFEQWEEMLSAFGALGGVAENIVLGHGPYGRGLFPRDQSKPILLQLPENLLFPVEDIEFLDGQIRIRNNSAVAGPERDFFQRYANAFSWGGGGRSESTAQIAALDALSPHVRAVLAADFGMGYLLQGDFIERTQIRFLESRLLFSDGRRLLMPLIELANHAPDGLPHEPIGKNGVQIRGSAHGEILVAYAHRDCLGLFRVFGFVGLQPMAFSLPMTVQAAGQKITIHDRTARQTRRGNFVSPQLAFDGNGISLSYLMIGNTKLPRLSRGIFRALMREAAVADADGIFDYILRINRQKLLRLLEALEHQRGEMALALRKTAHNQLEATTNCIGARDL